MQKKALEFKIIFVVILVVVLFLFGFKEKEEQSSLSKPTTNDHFNYIAINEILMWVSNNGDGSHDPNTDGSGFYWPGGENAVQAAIYEDGLVWGGKIADSIRFNGNTHRQGLQAGKILADGTADNPDLAKYRVYKIRKGWELFPPGPIRDAYERDYNEWPVEDGAPWVDKNGDGFITRGIDEPEFVGDEVLWYVANDLDTNRSLGTYGSLPLGLEFQTTIFGFNRSNDLADVVFKKYLIINKSQNTINDMILGYWSDTDLGDAGDDCSGCDTVLNLGYTYNGDNMDGTGSGRHYGENPPAVGYDFLQGPILPASATDSAKYNGRWIKGYKNLEMTAYIAINKFYPGPIPYFFASVEYYNWLSGLTFLGDSIINPITSEITKFMVPGDPTLSAAGGWHYLNWPGGPEPHDVRHLLASGPFTLAPGDSQEVVIGIIIARGENHLDSITELKRKSKAIQLAYDLDFNLNTPPSAPNLHASAKDKEITLWWEDNAENYELIDPLLIKTGFADTTYTFEGYRVWEYEDISGSNPQLLGIYDISNGMDVIEGRVLINGRNAVIPIIVSPDEGLHRHLTITESKIQSMELLNGSPYYFAVTAYGYSEFSDPTFLESAPQIIEVIPGTKKIDTKYIHENGDYVAAEHISGVGHGRVEFKVIDADYITGDEYNVVINGTADSLSLDLVNVTDNDTILQNFTEFDSLYYFSNTLIKFYNYSSGVEYGIITDETFIYENLAYSADGFLLLVQNQGKDSIELAAYGQDFILKEVLEVKGPGGNELTQPVDVIKNMNSTGRWQITTHGPYTDHRININWRDAIGFDSYEIRFTASGSEYYASGRQFSFTPPTRNDPKGNGRVPFEMWNVGQDLSSTDDDYRLIIKVLDLDRPDTLISIPDSSWSQLPNGDWEEIYAYFDDDLFADSIYTEPLPNESGTSSREKHFMGKIVIQGDLPEEGTVIRFVPWRHLKEGDVYTVTMTQPDKNSLTTGKNNIYKISAFPNPYFGPNLIAQGSYPEYIRFTNLPTDVKIRIFTLAGTFVKKIEKNDESSQWIDWDLKNKKGVLVGSGIFIAYIEMPGIGEKIMKIAVIL